MIGDFILGVVILGFFLKQKSSTFFFCCFYNKASIAVYIKKKSFFVMESNEVIPCKKCGDHVPENQWSLQCDFCDGWVHYKCLNINPAEYRRLAKQTFWFCSTQCGNQHDGVPKSQIYVSDDIPEDPSLKDLCKFVKELAKSNEMIFKLINDTKIERTELKKEIEAVKAENLELRSELNLCKMDIKLLKNGLNMLQQKEVSNQIIIHGIPTSTTTSLDTAVKHIFEENNIPVDGFVRCYRMGAKKSNSAQSSRGPVLPVICVMKDERMKIDLLQSIRKKKISAISDGISSNIRIFEYLTSYSRALLIEARKKLKDKFKFIWTSGGKILIKKDESTSTRVIKASEDIFKLSSQ